MLSNNILRDLCCCLPTKEMFPSGGVRLIYPAGNKFILGICHCLLDISAHVDDDFIKTYEVQIGSGILATNRQLPMYEEMLRLPSVQYIPGGATLNSIRIAQWILRARATEPCTGFMGAVGEDTYGDYIENICRMEGVSTCFMRIPGVPSGTCAVCIKNGERGLVASLSAANMFVLEHIRENETLLNSASIVYSSGFFLNCCQGKVSIFVAERTKLNGGIFCINLAAGYIPKKYPKELARLITLSDYVFGNDREAEAYGESIGLEDISSRNVARYIAKLPREKSGPRTVVITQGASCTVLARSDGLFMEIPSIRVPREHIVDLNAAGDSFVGGYLAGLALGQNPFACVRTGLLAACYIIQQSGCTFSGDFWEETSKLVFEESCVREFDFLEERKCGHNHESIELEKFCNIENSPS